MTRVEIAEGQGYKVWWAPISVAAGTTQLVPRQPGKKISVANYALVATGPAGQSSPTRSLLGVGT